MSVINNTNRPLGSNYNLVTFSNEMTISVLRFLESDDLLTVDTVNRCFRPLIKLAGIRNAISDVSIWEKNVGRVDLGATGKLPPIPRNFVDKARFGLPLFFPRYLIREVDENSPLELQETKNLPRLVENPDKMGLEPTGRTKELKIPVTLNNIGLLLEKYPLGERTQFEGIKVGPSICNRYGDKGIAPHWSFQFEYEGEAGEINEDVESVSLIDRILYHMFKYMKTGEFSQLINERIAARVPINNQRPRRFRQIKLEVASSSICLSLFSSCYPRNTAVHLPGESN